jgi:hypothetical protein
VDEKASWTIRWKVLWKKRLRRITHFAPFHDLEVNPGDSWLEGAGDVVVHSTTPDSRLDSSMPAAFGTDGNVKSLVLPYGHPAEVDSFHCRSSVEVPPAPNNPDEPTLSSDPLRAESPAGPGPSSPGIGRLL